MTENKEIRRDLQERQAEELAKSFLARKKPSVQRCYRCAVTFLEQLSQKIHGLEYKLIVFELPDSLDPKAKIRCDFKLLIKDPTLISPVEIGRMYPNPRGRFGSCSARGDRSRIGPSFILALSEEHSVRAAGLLKEDNEKYRHCLGLSPLLEAVRENFSGPGRPKPQVVACKQLRRSGQSVPWDMLI